MSDLDREPNRERYTVQLACGHQRRTTFPPLGATYPCADCGCGEFIDSVADTRTGDMAIVAHQREQLADERLAEMAATVDELRKLGFGR